MTKKTAAEVRRVRTISKRYETARSERKEAILSAVEAGVSPEEIAAASGLTRSAIYKIVSRSTGTSSRVPVGR
jgi:DNA-directed RNA polymerase specialized sigma24 family protein